MLLTDDYLYYCGSRVLFFKFVVCPVTGINNLNRGLPAIFIYVFPRYDVLRQKQIIRVQVVRHDFFVLTAVLLFKEAQKRLLTVFDFSDRLVN